MALRPRRKPIKTDEELVRFGISLPKVLLRQFDALLSGRQDGNRSEAIRSLIREYLAQDTVISTKSNQAATVTVVFEAQQPDTLRRLLEHQREMGSLLVSSLQVRLNSREELQVLVLRGMGAEIRMHAKRLLGLKGILLGKLVMTGTPEP